MTSQEPEKKPRRRVKKVKGHGGHHGGAWKVAYADFVTAMMALFLVLWLVSQADTKVKQAIANYFRSPGVFTTMQGGVLAGPTKVSKEPSALSSKEEDQALFGAAEMLQKRFEQRPEFSRYKDQIKVSVTEEGLKIDILDKAERVSFASSSAQITPDAQAILKEIASTICALPNPVSIGGHTDRHVFPVGSTYTNWELSADRANAARRELEHACLNPARIQRVVGFADTQLLLPEDPYAAANRRISITVQRMNPVSSDDKDDEAKGEKTLNLPITKSPRAETKAAAEPDAHEQRGRLPENRLSTEGGTVVGTPDKLPKGVRRTREAAPAAAESEH